MLILDTNHFTELERGTSLGQKLRERLTRNAQPAFLTIITAEGSMRGWLAQIRPGQDRAVSSYARFHRGLTQLAEWNIIPWSEMAADSFDDLTFQRIRIGTMDLRIASLALAYDALLLSRNLRHFSQVPGLRVENWLD